MEERLVARDVLHADNACRSQSYHFVYQLHGVAVGQEFADAVDVHYRCFVGIVDRCLHVVLAYLFAHLSCKLVVDGVAGSCGDDASLDGLAYEGEVADDVKQFVARALVFPYERLVLDVSQFRRIMVRSLNHVGQLVKLFLRNLLFVDDDGVVQVAAFYQVGFEQGFDVPYEHERACRCNLGGEMFGFVK